MRGLHQGGHLQFSRNPRANALRQAEIQRGKSSANRVARIGCPTLVSSRRVVEHRRRLESIKRETSIEVRILLELRIRVSPSPRYSEEKGSGDEEPEY